MAVSLLRVSLRAALSSMEKNATPHLMPKSPVKCDTNIMRLYHTTSCICDGDVCQIIPEHLSSNANPQLKMDDCNLLLAIKSRINGVPARHYSKRVEHEINRKQEDYDSDSGSDSDSDTETHGTKERSEFWRRKMRTFHRILDVNNDGIISFDDFLLIANRFQNLGHLDEHQAKEFHKVVRMTWEQQWGEVSPYNLITVEQYLEDMHHVLNDKVLKKKAHKFLPYLFKAVDKDKSGFISVNEFKLFFKCLNLTDEQAAVSFAIIDVNGDGKLSQKEFVKLGREFFLTEDEKRPSRMFWGPLIKQ